MNNFDPEYEIDMEGRKMNRKELNRHDFSGSYAPGSIMASQRTFSVGIFKWIARANGSGLKKSAVIHRVRGYVFDPDEVYGVAGNLCDYFDDGGKKKKRFTTL